MTEDAPTTAAIEAFLARARAPVSEADIAAGTGVDIGTAKRLLYEIMHRYECTLDVREDGTLVFDFGRALQPIGKPTLRERLRRAGRWLWRGFSAAYRASLAVVLVAYAVAFVVLIIAAAIAASAASKDEGPAEGAAHLVGAIFRAIFEFTTHSALIYADVDTFGYRHRHYTPRQSLIGGNASGRRKKGKKKQRENAGPGKKSFIASVYDFVLGPARVPMRDGAQDREVAAFVRAHGGVLTVADVQALSGMARDDAERFFARFVARFEGDAEVTEDGALVAGFPTLLQSETRSQDDPIIYFWDEYEPPFELTGNTSGRNLAITGLASFNLTGAAAVITSLSAVGGAAVLALGYVPLVIFSLFLGLPLLRWPWVWAQNREQHRTNIRKRLYREIFQGQETELSFAEIIARANAHRTTEETLDADAQRPLLEATAAEVGATFDINTSDQLALDAGHLRREIVARTSAKVEVEREAVVFSTR